MAAKVKVTGGKTTRDERDHAREFLNFLRLSFAPHS